MSPKLLEAVKQAALRRGDDVSNADYVSIRQGEFQLQQIQPNNSKNKDLGTPVNPAQLLAYLIDTL